MKAQANADRVSCEQGTGGQTEREKSTQNKTNKDIGERTKLGDHADKSGEAITTQKA